MDVINASWGNYYSGYGKTCTYTRRYINAAEVLHIKRETTIYSVPKIESHVRLFALFANMVHMHARATRGESLCQYFPPPCVPGILRLITNHMAYNVDIHM